MVNTPREHPGLPGLLIGAFMGAFLYSVATHIGNVVTGKEDRIELAKKEAASCDYGPTVIRYHRDENAEVLRMWDRDGMKNHYFRTPELRKNIVGTLEFGGDDRVLTFLALQRSSPDTQWAITALHYAPRESTPAACQRDFGDVLDKIHERWDISTGINQPYHW